MTELEKITASLTGFQVIVDDEDKELSNTVIKVGKYPNRIVCNTYVYEQIKAKYSDNRTS